MVCPPACRLPVQWASGRPGRKAWYCWEYSTSMSDTDLSMYPVFSYFLRDLIGLASLPSTVPSSFSPRHSSFSSVSSQLRFVCFCHWLKKIISLKRNSGPSRLLGFHKFSLKKAWLGKKRTHSRISIYVSEMRGIPPSTALVTTVCHWPFKNYSVVSGIPPW